MFSVNTSCIADKHVPFIPDASLTYCNLIGFLNYIYSHISIALHSKLISLSFARIPNSGNFLVLNLFLEWRTGFESRLVDHPKGGYGVVDICLFYGFFCFNSYITEWFILGDGTGIIG